MSQSAIEAVKGFSAPHDETQLQQLQDAVGAIRPQECGEPEFRALLSVFERFPEDDGYGIFWAIVHCLEACKGYESALVVSAIRSPTEFNLRMVNRLVNSGVTEVEGQSLLSVLASAAANPQALSSARKAAQGYIEYQCTQRHTDA